MSEPKIKHEAPNYEAILNWCADNRPDILSQVKEILESGRNSRTEGMVFLLTIGFAAGRRYQMEHPELKSDCEYHR